MSRIRVLLASDIHWCHSDYYGVSTKERMARFVRHVEEEHARDPLFAILLLGDYSLDHWAWNIKGCWLEEGRSNTKLFADHVLRPLEKLGLPMAVIAGNHEQYGRGLWREITGYRRTDSVVVGEYLFILPDTFGKDLNPKVHSDGAYCGADVRFIKTEMAKHPDKRVVLCAHHFAPQAESEAFRALVREEDRILCMVGGHVHHSFVAEPGEAWGNKPLLYTGHYSYNGGGEPPATSMWGFRDLVLDGDTLTSRYITPANEIVYKGETISHPYGYQDEYTKKI